MQQDFSAVDWNGVVSRLNEKSPGTVKLRNNEQEVGGIKSIGSYRPYRPLHVDVLGANPEVKICNNTERRLLDALDEHPPVLNPRYTSYDSSSYNRTTANGPHSFMAGGSQGQQNHSFPSLSQSWGSQVDPSQKWGQ